MHSRRRSSLLLLLLLITVLATPAQGATLLRGAAEPAAAPAAPEAVQTTPTPVIDNQAFDEWTIGGGLAYWKKHCQGGEFPSDGYLRRIPTNGGTVKNMITMTPAAGTCYYMYKIVADEAGMYYFNTNQNRIELLQKSAPQGPAVPIYTPSLAPLIPVSPPKLDANNIYWVASNTLQRAARNGSGGLAMVATGANVKDLVVSPTHIYWLDDTGMWAVEKNCATAAICASTKIKMQTTTGRYLLYHPFFSLGATNMYIYWAEIGTPERIRRIACSAPTTCSAATTVYTAPSDNPWKIGQLLKPGFLASGDLYWTEKYAKTVSGITTRDGNLRR